MDRNSFQDLFQAAGPVVLPVIHVLEAAQANRNLQIALVAGCPGVFLINHDFPVAPFLPIIREVRQAHPSAWIGVNFLAVTGREAFPRLAGLQAEGCRIDAYWGDDARIDEAAGPGGQVEAHAIDAAYRNSGWQGLYFGGVAFKKQRAVAPEAYRASAELASAHMDVVTTSGVATGQAADPSKVQVFRQGCGETALGLASGVTPENAAVYAPYVDAFLVATGINLDGDFYNIDPAKLDRLMTITQEIGEEGD